MFWFLERGLWTLFYYDDYCETKRKTNFSKDKAEAENGKHEAIPSHDTTGRTHEKRWKRTLGTDTAEEAT